MDRGDVERLFQLLTSELALGERFERNALGFTNAYVTVGPRFRNVLNGSQKLEMGVSLGGGKKSVVGKAAVASASTSRAKGKGKAAVVEEEYYDYGEEDEEDDYQPPPKEWNPLARSKTKKAAAAAPQFKSAEFIDDDEDEEDQGFDADGVLANLMQLREQVSLGFCSSRLIELTRRSLFADGCRRGLRGSQHHLG
jgi:hypothetical protein